MNVIFLDCTNNYGYGYGACVTKIGLMARGLKEHGANCIIHNGVVGISQISKDETKIIDGISVTTYNKRGRHLISLILNLKKLYLWMRSKKKDQDRNIIILEGIDCHLFITYVFLSRILGYKILIISHEWGPTIISTNPLRRLLFWIFAKTFGWLVDGILPISEYIIEKIKHFGKPYLKVPIIADYSVVEHQIANKKRNVDINFLYCTSVFYVRVISLVLNSYKLYKEKGGVIGLKLVLNGPVERIDIIKRMAIDLGIENSTVFLSRLTYNDLLREYSEAIALLVPLDPNCEQDKARFSQKIAEYLSSKSPIITSNVGEIKYYFSDDDVIKAEYSEEGFANKLLWVERNFERSKEIGKQGFILGHEVFNYKRVGFDLKSFLDSLF